MKKSIVLFAAAALTAMPAIAQEKAPVSPEDTKDISLPAPRQVGGMPLMNALKLRQSTRSFSAKPLPEETLSSLLWAAFGVNRPESGMRTAASSYNCQDIILYVFTETGVWTYDAAANKLVSVKTGDHRKLAGMQDYVWSAPLSIVYVSDTTTMDRKMTLDAEGKLSTASIDAGLIMQNVYLFCASEGLGCVARASVDKAAFAKAFNLPETHLVVVGQTIGYPAE